MKQTTTIWRCDRCREQFDYEEIIHSDTYNIYRSRGVAFFSRKYEWRDIVGDHIGDDVMDLCATCAELVERVIKPLEQNIPSGLEGK